MRPINYDAIEVENPLLITNWSICVRNFRWKDLFYISMFALIIILFTGEVIHVSTVQYRLNSSILKLNDKITSYQESTVNSLSKLDDRVVVVETGINRLMSNATSNAAVLDQLGQMHNELQKVVTGMNTQLKTTKEDITKQLSQTKLDLEDAMVDAKQAINTEVDHVKENMDIYISITNQKLSTESDFIKYEIAGTFTLLGCMISLWHVSAHLRHMGKPSIQRRVLAILWMVPIYSITSWLSLVFPSVENFLGAFRDCYEAYAVYTFMAWLITVLSDDNGTEVNAVTVLSLHVKKHMNKTYHLHHTTNNTINNNISNTNNTNTSIMDNNEDNTHVLKPPCPCCYNNSNARSIAANILYQCQAMAMQFVLFKPLLASLPILLELCGIKYYNVNVINTSNNNQINWLAPKLYVIFALNISVAIAFYGLLSFYHATKDILAWCDPWPKFLCIKGVVFMTFWQGFAINVLSGLGLVDEISARSTQNLIICIEMLVASILHVYIFPYEEWQEGYKREKERSILLRDTLALKDFVEDIKGLIFKKAFEGVLQLQDQDVEVDVEANNSDTRRLNSTSASGNNSIHHSNHNELKDVINLDDVILPHIGESLHKLKNDIEVAVSDYSSSPSPSVDRSTRKCK